MLNDVKCQISCHYVSTFFIDFSDAFFRLCGLNNTLVLRTM